MLNSTAQTIVAQNDDFRLHPNKGTLCLTADIRALGDLCVKEIIGKVRVCVILKKYGITKPTYYRYKKNFGC